MLVLYTWFQYTCAQSITPVSQAPLAVHPGIPAAAPVTSIPTVCELQVLTLLGWQHAYNPAGYAIYSELPANCSSSTWQSLGCLVSLTNLTLTGSLPALPDSWSNGSFPALQVLNLSSSRIAGTLPASWGEPSASAT